MQRPQEGEHSRPLQETLISADAESLWPLGIFLLLSAVCSWTVWLWPIDNRERLLLFVFGIEFKIPLLSMKLVIGNCLPGVLAVIWALFEGKNQLRRMLSNLTMWRVPLQWYIVAVALPWAVFLGALDAVTLYSPADYSFPSASSLLKGFAMTVPFGPLWEELAWRAFALGKLESRYSLLVSALLLGVYWAVWHIPMWIVQLDSIPVTTLPLVSAFTNLIAWSIVFSYLYHCSSGSLPVVILLHAMYGPAAQLSLALTYVDLDMYVIYLSTILSVCLAIAFAIPLSRMNRLSVDLPSDCELTK